MNKLYFFITILLFELFSCGPNSPKNGLKFNNLLVDYVENPTGLKTQTPRFTWKVSSRRMGGSQQSYQILVASDRDKLNKNSGDMWDSGIVDHNQSVNVSYKGKTLESVNGEPFHFIAHLMRQGSLIIGGMLETIMDVGSQ